MQTLFNLKLHKYPHNLKDYEGLFMKLYQVSAKQSARTPHQKVHEAQPQANSLNTPYKRDAWPQ